MPVLKAVGAERWGKREQRTGSWRGWGVSKQDTAAAAQEGRFSKYPEFSFLALTQGGSSGQKNSDRDLSGGTGSHATDSPSLVFVRFKAAGLLCFLQPAFCNRKT